VHPEATAEGSDTKKDAHNQTSCHVFVFKKMLRGLSSLHQANSVVDQEGSWSVQKQALCHS
jgi:hypothetical protein